VRELDYDPRTKTLLHYHKVDGFGFVAIFAYNVQATSAKAAMRAVNDEPLVVRNFIWFKKLDFTVSETFYKRISIDEYENIIYLFEMFGGSRFYMVDTLTGKNIYYSEALVDRVTSVYSYPIIHYRTAVTNNVIERIMYFSTITRDEHAKDG